MSVEIRELILRAQIVDRPPSSRDADDPINPQQLITACVEQVLEILRRERER